MTNQASLLSALVNKAILNIEGQEIPCDLEIARDDELLRRILAPLFPGAISAKFERKEEGEILQVKVIKQLGSKGHFLINVLDSLPESENTLIVVYKDFLKGNPRSLTANKALQIEKQIDEAIDKGEEEKKILAKTLKVLDNVPAVAASVLIQGF